MRAVLLALIAPIALAGCSKPNPAPLVTFPPGFQFGFATVQYQVEGTMRADGTRVASNWSQWEETPGHIADGTHNDYGNGFRQLYDADIGRAAGLGANAFSFAIDWARLEPSPGVFDDAELQHVIDVVKSIRAHGMRPIIVLFHWVTPTWVQSPKDNRDLLTKSDQSFVDAFLPLVKHVVPPLAGMVDDWVTLEEPFSIIAGEYIAGVHPPGKVLDIKSADLALVNLMYLNARTYHLVKKLDTKDADGDGVAANVGFENLAAEVTPVDPHNPADVAGAKRIDYVINDEYMKGVIDGDIDIDLDGKVDNPTTVPPERHDPALAHTADFIGLNYYQRIRVEPGLLRNFAPLYATPLVDVRQYDASLPHSDMYQEISAKGLLVEIKDYSKWGLPLYVTENGEADADDDQRPYFLLQHMDEVGRAIADGYDVRGYYCWTIADNFEWADGFAPRFGLYKVDYTKPGFPRTRTRSADVYSDIAKAKKIDQATWNRYALKAYPVGIP